MTPRSFYVIGAGNVGIGLAYALRQAGHNLVGVWNRGRERRERARALLGGEADQELLAARVYAADWVFVCVADDAVATIGAALAQLGPARPGAVIAHTSGLLAAHALGPIPGGAALASMHPIVACAQPLQAAAALSGASFTLEGDAAAVRELSQAVRDLGGHATVITAAQKPRYHAALAMAANLLTALVGRALAEAGAAGFNDTAAVLALARGALALVEERGPAAALTGPVRRGDALTVRAHLDSIAAESRPAYVELSRVALAMAESQGLAPERALLLRQLLTEATGGAGGGYGDSNEHD